MTLKKMPTKSCISIHALARRATCRRQTRQGRTSISIHALARRATHFSFLSHIDSSDFNPRSRKESDSYI